MQKSATPPATPGILRRVICMLYEALLLVAVLFVASFLFISFTHDALSTSIKPVFRGYLLLVIAAYFIWFWLHGGQTLAMKTWRMRLERTDGSGLTLMQAAIRFIASLFSISLFGIGILWALFDRDKQFLHDRLAGTRIVRVEK